MNTNKLKKQLVLVLMSGFFASVLVGCNGGSSGSSTVQPSKTLAAMPDYPLRYSLVKATKEDTIAKKKKRSSNKLHQVKNGKSLQTFNPPTPVDYATDALNFLNMFAIAMPELNLFIAPTRFVVGIFSSDGLDTGLSDIVQSIQLIDSELQQIQNQLNYQESEIANSVKYTATQIQILAMSQYSTNTSAIGVLWGKFNGGIQGSTPGTTWYPNQESVVFTTYPDVNQFNDSISQQSLELTSNLGYTLGFTTNVSDGSIVFGDGTGLQSILGAELSLFKATEFQQAYGQPIGRNVANDIRTYNQQISNYFHIGIDIIQQLYIMQKTANIFTYQTGNTYNGPLASIAPLNFDLISNATESQNTAAFNTAQENLDNWVTGAANQLFLVITPYIISDTPFTNLSNAVNELYYPYGAASLSEQQQWMGTGAFGPIPGAGIVPNMVKTQSLVNPVINGGMPQITNSNTTNPSQFVFYVESGLGNPNQYITAYQNAWSAAGGPITFTESQINSVFAYDSNGDVPNYIATPGYYDGQNLQMWAQDWWGNQASAPLTNLTVRCSNNGSAITSFNDGGTVNGQFFGARTFGWSCPTNPNPAYVGNNTTALISFQSPSDYDANGAANFFGLMDPSNDAFTNVSGSGALGSITITGNNSIWNNYGNWNQSYNTADFNVVMNVGNYNFAPTLQLYYYLTVFYGKMYCGSNDPLCSIDPVTNNICVAGQVVGLNWVNQGTFMFGAYVPGTNNQQHCYNS